MRAALAIAAATLALALAACGGGSDSASGETQAATTSAATGATAEATTAVTESDGAPCTKEALAEGAQPSFGSEKIEILDGYVCEGGWAAGPILIGPAGSEEQIEAAFMLKAEDGKWTVPAELPCDNPDVPEPVLNNSPCRVS